MTAGKKLQIVFKTDAALEIGIGHVMRCLTLAEALACRGAECTFVVGESAKATIPLLGESGFPTFVSDSFSDSDSLRSRFADGVDCLVVDDYRLDQHFEMACRKWTKKIFVIDKCQIISEGTHSSLLEDSPIYKNFYEKQIRKD